MYFIKTIIDYLKDKEYMKLMIITTSTIGVGTIMYHIIEGWSWLDSLYFSVITLTTIGYGDLAPITAVGKLFTIIYIIFGLGIILNFIEVVHHHYEEHHIKS